MDSNATYKSRRGKIEASQSDIYNFVTDLRNFGKFLPEGRVENIVLDEANCSFEIAGMGKIDISLIMRNPYDKVVFEGFLFGTNRFIINMDIIDSIEETTEVQVTVDAQLNPMLKMMLGETLNKFLGMLIDEMENFKGWSTS